MKLWEIKAMSLRIMFSDSGIKFNEEEFQTGVVYANGNTEQYLIRMEDSIRRAIDTYYSIVGEPTLVTQIGLETKLVDGLTTYLNKIDFSVDVTYGFPSRIDVEIYDVDEDEVSTLRSKKQGIDFAYDHINKRIFFVNESYNLYGANVVFDVWYKMAKINIPNAVEEMTYDLDTIHIPEEVQRMLCFYVKGELFEEDEPNLAVLAMNNYYGFLSRLRKPFSNVQKKVRRSKLFDKTN